MSLVKLIKITHHGREVEMSVTKVLAKRLLKERPFKDKPHPSLSTFKLVGKMPEDEVTETETEEVEETQTDTAEVTDNIDYNKLAYPELQKLYSDTFGISGISIKKADLIGALKAGKPVGA